jgi:TPR repeat protein
MYEQGDGVERDLRLARYWYDAAAKNGDVAAPGKVQEMDARLRALHRARAEPRATAPP